MLTKITSLSTPAPLLPPFPSAASTVDILCLCPSDYPPCLASPPACPRVPPLTSSCPLSGRSRPPSFAGTSPPPHPPRPIIVPSPHPVAIVAKPPLPCLVRLHRLTKDMIRIKNTSELKKEVNKINKRYKLRLT